MHIREGKSPRPWAREADQVPEGFRSEGSQCKDLETRWVWKDLWGQRSKHHVPSCTGAHYHTLCCFFPPRCYESVPVHFLFGLQAGFGETHPRSLAKEVLTTNPWGGEEKPPETVSCEIPMGLLS